MADKNAILVWNEEKQTNEFVYVDATTEEIAEAKRQREEREAELAVEETAKAELATLATKAAEDIESITSLLTEVKDPAVQKLLEIIFTRLDLNDKSSGIDHTAILEVKNQRKG